MAIATFFRRNTDWANIGNLIDFQCGKCNKRVDKVIFNEGGTLKSITFFCHGWADTIELSEAQLNAPKRLRGYRPFSNRTGVENQNSFGNDGPKLTEKEKVEEERKQFRRDMKELERLKEELAREQQRTYQPPICQRCYTPVSIMWYRQEMTRQTVFVFRCHGASEEFRVDEIEMRRPDFGNRIANYKAFALTVAKSQRVDELDLYAVNGFTTSGYILGREGGQIKVTINGIDYYQANENASEGQSKPKSAPMLQEIEPRRIKLED